MVQYGWVTPNRISFSGFLVGGIGAAICILILPLWTAGVLLAVGDVLDYLDGDLARRQGTDSREGAIFDAVLDRYTDFLVIGALTYLTTALLDRYTDFLIGGLSFLTSEIALLTGLAALLGSVVTPYVRAKTEAESKKSIPTAGDRGWRNRILIVGLLLSQPIWTLGAVAVVANIAAVHRLFYAMRKSDDRGS
ncbi:MAG: CDP-alcohol phosphatidyltransferase family protein [Chloroflexi bacterium]|nr:CDP-alcohol phosphatidyltransferase family protein [Chloroflexota bacterium]MCH8849966.1 CDP-alcohol phosphatidyltransferase family protein [Chloroflexota bacterium]MCI0778948.1 CDP-alcohol phosphatidyltransferase family protein [Chloroflexota bacterium]MCI0821197.1 CDP-alcohol phosphatidyltransferase family protein [Chloroflexota bacterium]